MEYKLKNFEAILAEMLRLQQKWYSATDPLYKHNPRNSGDCVITISEPCVLVFKRFLHHRHTAFTAHRRFFLLFFFRNVSDDCFCC